MAIVQLGSTAPLGFSFDPNFTQAPREGEPAVPHLIQPGFPVWIQRRIWNTTPVPVAINITAFGGGNISHGISVSCWRIARDGFTPDSHVYFRGWEKGESVHLRIYPFTGVILNVLVAGVQDGAEQVVFSDLQANQGAPLPGLQVIECRVLMPGDPILAGSSGATPSTLPGVPGTAAPMASGVPTAPPTTGPVMAAPTAPIAAVSPLTIVSAP